jgi:hypothetical protein
MATKFDGDSNHVKYSNLNSVSGLLLENKTAGKILWNVPVNISGADLDANVVIGDNFVSVNSNALLSLNVSANITIKIPGLISPAVKKDGMACGASCTNLQYNGTHVSFTAQGFSNYTIEEGFGVLNITVDDSVISPVGGSYVNATFNVLLKSNITSHNIKLVSPSGVNYQATCTAVTALNLSCVVPMQFYYEPGYYNISTYVANGPNNESLMFENKIQYNELLSITKSDTEISFSGALSGNISSDGGIVLSNIGNAPITTVTVTAYNLVGAAVPSEILNVSYFRAGSTYNTSVQLQHGVPINISYSLDPGNSSNAIFDLWLNAPTGIYPQTYVATTPWSIVMS